MRRALTKKGWLMIASSKWQVLGYGEGWAITYFAKTLFTPAGIDIYIRAEQGISCNAMTGTSVRVRNSSRTQYRYIHQDPIPAVSCGRIYSISILPFRVSPNRRCWDIAEKLQMLQKGLLGTDQRHWFPRETEHLNIIP